jgi:hypothetical protein
LAKESKEWNLPEQTRCAGVGPTIAGRAFIRLRL